MRRFFIQLTFALIFLTMAIKGKGFEQVEEGKKYFPVEDPLVADKLEKWQDAKFGLLMHWGTYSQWGIVESWSLCPEDYGWCQRRKGKNPKNYFEYKKEYENLLRTFNPVQFDPQKWAKAARDAGMKYVVFTTKHHDGFCMWDTKETDYKITSPDCPFHRNQRADVSREIFNAFRDEGFMVGAYFSKADWHCPYYWDPYFPPFDRNVNYDPELYPEKWERFVQFTHNQIMELMTNYGKIDILWLDAGWVARQSKEDLENFYQKQLAKSNSGFLKQRIVNQDIRMDELVKKAREKQPGLIVVDRAVPGPNQNYLTPENVVPEKPLPYPWESCIISGGGWSYTPNAKYKSATEVVQLLADIVSKGGNLLLNIAPGPDGTWQKGAYQMLAGVGKWMAINKEAIYETRPYKVFGYENIRFTRKKASNVVYAIYLAQKNKEKLPEKVVLDKIKPKPESELFLLGDNEPLNWFLTEEGVVISIRRDLQENPPCEGAWVFRIEISA